MVNSLLSTITCIDLPSDPVEQEIPDLYLSCAVTRAMAKKAKQNDDLTDTFWGQSFKREITKSLSSSLSGKQSDLSDNTSECNHYSSISNDQCQDHDLVSRSQLYQEQHNDPKLFFCLKQLLMRKK